MTDTSRPVLYSFRRCPYAMRARLALIHAGLGVELREIVLRNKPQSMLDASPKGTVPVLILPDGRVLDESLDIMHHALGTLKQTEWYPADAVQQVEIDVIIAANDGPFKHALDRYKYPNRYPDEAVDPLAQRAVCAEIIASYEVRLERHGGGLVAGKLTLADYAILPFVRQFAHVDTDWFYAQPWPRVIAWLDRFKASPLFEAAMVKHKPWTPGDAAVEFATEADAPLQL